MRSRSPDKHAFPPSLTGSHTDSSSTHSPASCPYTPVELTYESRSPWTRATYPTTTAAPSRERPTSSPWTACLALPQTRPCPPQAGTQRRSGGHIRLQRPEPRPGQCVGPVPSRRRVHVVTRVAPESRDPLPQIPTTHHQPAHATLYPSTRGGSGPFRSGVSRRTTTEKTTRAMAQLIERRSRPCSGEATG